MMLLAALQGWRAAEIARVRGDMFDLDSGIVRWVGKGGLEQQGEIHELVREEVVKYPSGYWFPSRSTNTLPHIHYRSVSDLMTKAMRRVGIDDPKLTGHSLRHYFGSELFERGVDIRVIQEMMGHANLSTTALYTRVSRGKQQDAIGRLGTDLPEWLKNPARRPHRTTRARADG
jgi:site-specific recombinase XerD